ERRNGDRSDLCRIRCTCRHGPRGHAGVYDRPAPPPPGGERMSGPVRAPGVLACLATMLFMDLMPRLIGLRRTFTLLRRMTADRIEPANAGALITETTHRVSVAAAFYP